MRTGIGFDAHKFSDNRPLILGGVHIETDRGLEGHSDADVLTHAIMDALLGSYALGDIGRHFPDSDNQYKDACSVDMMRSIIEKYNMKIINIDTVIICEEPKLLPYVEKIRSSIADNTNTAIEGISVKATTTEMMGFTGRKEGIAAIANVLVE